MGRYIRNSLLLAKVETTESVDAVPAGTTDAVLISEVSVNPLNAQNVNRDLYRPYFGASPELVGTSNVTIDFAVELAGSGTVGTAPQWGKLMRGCGMKELIDPKFCEYRPDVPTAAKSLTIYYYDDGLVHKMLGARGTFKPDLSVGSIPKLKFSYMGRYGGVVATPNPTADFTQWKQPAVITDRNTRDVMFGSTYADSILTGGSSYISRGMQLDYGNNVQFTPLVGAEYIDITERSIKGNVVIDLTPAAEVQMITSVLNNDLTSFALEHGLGAGNVVGVYLPQVQLINPTKQDVNGRRMIGFDMRGMPKDGNDDIIFYAR